MVTAVAVAAALESPVPAPALAPARQRHRLANGAAGTADFELRHWRPATGKRASSGMRGRWAPPEIEIPNGGALAGAGYTSLRDILSSPEYAAAAAKASSPCAGEGGGGAAATAAARGSCGDVHMIRHPLVKHAAYTYLHLTPSGRADGGRRRRRRQGPLCRLLLGFFGALFRR